MIQTRRIVNISLEDHLIISEKSYLSFLDTGLMSELEKSLRYVPEYKIRHEYELKKLNLQKEEELRMKKMIVEFKKRGVSEEMISEVTGISLTKIKKLKYKWLRLT